MICELLCSSQITRAVDQLYVLEAPHPPTPANVSGQLSAWNGMLIALPVVAALPVMLDFVGIHLRTERVRPPASRDASQEI